MSVQLHLVDREPGLDLSVGALVVYGSHGIGRVTGPSAEHVGQRATGKRAPTVVVEFQSGLSVILPLELAQSLLRPPAGASEVEDVRAALRSRDVPVDPSWQARSRATREKIATGDLAGLAEVVRVAVERRRRSSGSSGLSFAEQELYDKARRLLVSELVGAAGIQELEAEEWIDDQLARSGE